ncbi:MAG: zinc ribbon domain-containing protein, partial [Christensenellaceae bacterium]|nr:zinc ribbon domain-containing protein [Christensenellaceae bacterium]
EELDRLNAELEAKKKELEELAGKKNCPSCGAPIDKGSMFCSSCGAKITAEEPAAEEPAAPAGPVCPNCGQPVPEGHMFCTSCGTKIEK